MSRGESYNCAMLYLSRLLQSGRYLVVFSALLFPGIIFAETMPSPEGMVSIPAGFFEMGLDDLPPDSPWGQENAKPKRRVFLPDFFIDRYEVTYGEYLKFDKSHVLPDRSQNGPVTMVSWTDADSYCDTLGKRLPSEAEWEKAARGTDGRIYPWGNVFDPEKSNIGKHAKAVGSFPEDKSPYGVFDMAGNVSEWTDSWYRPYPGSNYQSPDYGIFQKVVRGGAFNPSRHFADEMFAQVTFRNYNRPHIAGSDNGFRCAKSASEKTEE